MVFDGNAYYSGYEEGPSIYASRRIVVTITGLAGAGKSTVADRLIDDNGFRRGKFANALKEMLRAFLRYRKVDDATIERMLEGDLKGEPSEHFLGKSPREAMQTLGTEWGRNCIHPDLWVDTEFLVQELGPYAGAEPGPPMVIDDCRFPNEAAAIRAIGGTVIGVERPEAPGATMAHSSEGYSLTADVTLQNRNTLERFKMEIDQLAKELTWSY